MTRVRFLFVVLLVSLLAGCCVWTTQTRRTSGKTFPEQLRDNTVALVEVGDDDEDGREVRGPYCTGVWIDYDVFITAAHCVEYDDPHGFFDMFDIKTPAPIDRKILYLVEADVPLRGKPDPDDARVGKVTAYEKDIDLALVTVEHETMPRSHPVAWIERGTIRPGDSVHAMGHTVGYWWTYHRGFVSNVRWTDGPHDNNILLFQLSVVTWSGNSGGGIWNDAGNLIGISSWINTRSSSMSFAIHRDTIVDFLGRSGVR